MAEITASMIKELRERTQAGMLDCKKALTETDGDLEKASEFLRKKGLASVGKRAGREAKEGIVVFSLSDDKKNATLLEINCETDFVAKNDGFRVLAENVLMKIVASSAKTAEELPADIIETIDEGSAKTGEKTTIGRFKKFSIDGSKHGVIASYIHSNSKIGVMVQLTCDKAEAAASADLSELGKEIAMQAAASSPQYLNETEVPADVIAKEKDIYFEQMKSSGKPQQILEKIVEGKVKKFFTDVCLIDQVYLRDNAKTIKSLVEEYAKKLGCTISVDSYYRIQIGS